jgi:hypothetical protein
MNIQKENPSTTTPTQKKILSQDPTEPSKPKTLGTEGWFSEEAKEAMDLISFVPSSMRDYVDKNDKNPLESILYEEAMKELEKNKDFKSKKYVYIDAHILSTPIIRDLDDDGKDELILSVSYYFDKEYYSDPQNLKKLDHDIDITKYVAGGIVAFDLSTLKVIWSQRILFIT